MSFKTWLKDVSWEKGERGSRGRGCCKLWRLLAEQGSLSPPLPLLSSLSWSHHYGGITTTREATGAAPPSTASSKPYSAVRSSQPRYVGEPHLRLTSISIMVHPQKVNIPNSVSLNYFWIKNSWVFCIFLIWKCNWASKFSNFEAAFEGKRLLVECDQIFCLFRM